MITRRTVLAGVVGTFALAACGSDLPDGVPGLAAGKTISGTFVSRRRRGVETGWSINYPPGHGGERLRVLVALHARGGSHRGVIGGGLHLDRYLAQAVQHGTRPYVIAAVDGGDHEYWHPRADGDVAGMVVHEFLPLLGDHGLDLSRIGLFGWSMGGYGALYLSTVLRAPRIAVTVAESPAIWRHSYQSASGAFDSAADFATHSIWGRQQELAGIALRLDCGAGDGFAPVTRELRASISPRPAGGIESGGHDEAYWRSQAPAQLSYVGSHLPR